ncbi:hypothetical protein [Umezawaea sp. Da 62-37]|uniref:hypothetical protein n=1 Tax=Umezawaea sp. Da 62-37 TaxID=3075927 RepID=UPI0028F7405C|nr:hypothetical protein [Umezawaea sp. Da 62-37]WNV88406.1 hypothetical protein RM788_08960 [Umezawaea sp. Da 62-37]
MRWLTLYARSRQVPASVTALLISTTALWFLTAGDTPGFRMASIALATAVAVMAVGLGGQDLDLDRTAAVRWLPRRAAHVLLIGTLAATALLALQSAGPDLAPTAFVIRDSAGLMGLAALAATAFGAQYAWTLPFAWPTIAFFIPHADSNAFRASTWMLQPPDTPAATWTALTLAVLGTTAYAVAGPRR